MSFASALPAWIPAWLPPGSLLILGALLLPLLRGRLLQGYLVALPVLSLGHLLLTPVFDPSAAVTWSVLGLELNPVRLDGLSRIFGLIFHLAALLGMIYALHLKSRLQHAAALIYTGSAIAAVLAGDLITLFIFWELTAISSVFLIWARRTSRARRAGLRYLVIQVASGVLLLAGAAVWQRATGSVEFGAIGLDGGGIAGLGGWLIFLAFGIKACFPFLHGWMQDAYPEATITGTVFLSGFTTKLAIYALARSFAGTDLLIPIGALMTAFPIFYAVIENDLRRVLAYSLNNQLGFMVVGIGIGTELALNGAAAHAFAHILYKALLFMSMGAVLLRAKTVNGSDLGGLYKSMPWTCAFCCIGAASISAFPLFSGFVTKSMILSAAAKEHHTLVYLVLLFASAGVFHHSGIKIPYFAFFAHDRGIRVKEAPFNMLLAMGLTAFLCIFVGVAPGLLYDLLPFGEGYHPYTTAHVITQLQLLLFSALAFVFLQKTGLYPPELRSVNLDVDGLYRRFAPAVLAPAGETLARTWARAAAGVQRTFSRLLALLKELYGPQSVLGEPWPTGRTTLLAALLLALYLVLYYFR
ncbi:MAG: Na(+)/H(+) antiporter subunit D [Acidobacteriota bacterium]